MQAILRKFWVKAQKYDKMDGAEKLLSISQCQTWLSADLSWYRNVSHRCRFLPVPKCLEFSTGPLLSFVSDNVCTLKRTCMCYDVTIFCFLNLNFCSKHVVCLMSFQTISIEAFILNFFKLNLKMYLILSQH